MGSKSYDSYSGMSSKGASVGPSQTDTSKFAGGYVPDGKYSSANVKGTRLPNAGAHRTSARKGMKY